MTKKKVFVSKKKPAAYVQPDEPVSENEADEPEDGWDQVAMLFDPQYKKKYAQKLREEIDAGKYKESSDSLPVSWEDEDDDREQRAEDDTVAPFSHPQDPDDEGGLWHPGTRSITARTDKPEDFAAALGEAAEEMGIEVGGFGVESLPAEIPSTGGDWKKTLLLAVWGSYRDANPAAIVGAIESAVAKVKNEPNREPLRKLASRASVRYQTLLEMRKYALAEIDRLDLVGEIKNGNL